VRLLCPHCPPPDGLWLLSRYLTFISKLSSTIIALVRLFSQTYIAYILPECRVCVCVMVHLPAPTPVVPC
jgi:hypothetical protein